MDIIYLLLGLDVCFPLKINRINLLTQIICKTISTDPLSLYNKMVRPVKKYNDTLNVYMAVTLMQILELNERRQFLAASVMYTFVSHESRITYWVDDH